MPEKKPTVDDILKKYSSKIESKIQTSATNNNFSREYTTFKEEMAPNLTRYEKLCKSLGNSFKIKISPKVETTLAKQLEIAHLDLQPQEAYSLSILSSVGLFFITLLISVSIFLINKSFPFGFFILMSGVSWFLFYFVKSYPERLANQWRLKASSQMVPALLYVVVYMRHTPNLEKAIAFAAEHLEYPLALDFRKVFYNVEIGKFSTIKESLDNYLESWRDYSFEFIEAFHLIESSLFEPDEERRITTLERSLQVVLDGVYDKMLKYTHDVRSPLTNVYMLTVVLPVLGIALLPLASVLVGGFLKWYHVFILYTLILPFMTLYFTDKIMFLRPGGYGETSFLEKNPLYPKYKSNESYVNAFSIAFPIIILGLLPLIFQYTPFPALLGMTKDFSFSEIGLGFFGKQQFFGFITTSGSVSGPFGMGALLLSLLVPFGIALFFIIAYKEKTKELIIERNKTKQLEDEFNNSLFQLGNRLGNGMPPELAFGKVAESSSGLITENFFKTVNYNIRQNGMNVERAIFDSKRGAIIQYPSALIATSMRILIESSKKGLKIAALSLMSISQYIKNIQKITQRLRDMLAEIISDMKSNITFLAPLLLGIVIGLAAMITAILNSVNVSGLSQAGGSIGSFQSLLSIFDLTKMISPYYLQIAIGIYLIEMIFILTRTLVTIDSGEDKLQNTNQIGRNLRTGVVFYIITAFIAIIILFALSSIVVSGFG